MKKLISLTVLATALVSGQMALAAAPATTSSKVCVVQIAKVLQGSPEIKQDVADLKNKFSKDQKKIEADQAALDKANKDFQKNEMVMSAADKEKAMKSIAQQRQDVLKEMTDFQTKLTAEQKSMMDVVFKQLNKIIQAQAQSMACNVVLDSQFVLWADNQFDITDSVQTAFDKENAKK